MRYLTPGPVQIPKQVVEAFGRQPHFHKLEEFKEVFKEVTEKLSKVTTGDPIIIPGTGTLAVDAMVYNFIDPGDKVIALSYGEFSERLIESLECRGAEVFRLSVGVGKVPHPDVVEDFAKKVGSVAAIALVHNETGAGTCNRYLSKLRGVADSLGALLLIDSVSGIPAEPIDCVVDVIATSSQKAFIAPPGAAILYLNSKPRAKHTMPRSINLNKFLKSIKEWDTPYTPPINVIYALDASLSYILRIGLSNYHEMHKMKAEYLYSRISLKSIADEPFRSYTVAAFFTDKVDGIVNLLKSKGFVISRGVGEIKDRSIRIGVMGEVSLDDIKRVVEIVNDYVGK
ncbi:MAG: aminotransferase class V-fold PLP-dependent enzyme [Sulfolobales archaeon]|nr:aminotransferase class V-fold PLP-dependent enzyme [Sulfolobales archaeon]MCX8185810.1 aminotransferase class V-fold PLP-dependent enzyme [Sulfolobales archaeon]MDW7969305.1 aminotransferase class V-fold PLP-dependent enzyme [Sulfolobales archaeon]